MSNNQDKLNQQLFNVIADEKVSDEARLKKLKYLVRLGADVNAKMYGKSILSLTIDVNKEKEIEEFLREKGAVEWKISEEESECLGEKFWDKYNDLVSIDEINELLKKGANVNQKNEYDVPLLNSVLSTSLLEDGLCLERRSLAKRLIHLGADVNEKDSCFMSALMLACKNGEKEIVVEFIKKGADVDARDIDGDTVLMKAVTGKNAEIVKLLLNEGVDIEAKNHFSETALMKATFVGDVKVVETLLKAGADINTKNEYGDTVLMEACCYGQNYEIVELLLKSGVDVNACNTDKKTALMVAAKNGLCDEVKLLIEAGADVNAKDEDGETALEVCKNDEVAKIIKEHINKNKEKSIGIKRIINVGNER